MLDPRGRALHAQGQLVAAIGGRDVEHQAFQLAQGLREKGGLTANSVDFWSQGRAFKRGLAGREMSPNRAPHTCACLFFCKISLKETALRLPHLQPYATRLSWLLER